MLDASYCCRRSVVYLSVCHVWLCIEHELASTAKAAERIEMLFGVLNRVGLKNHAWMKARITGSPGIYRDMSRHICSRYILKVIHQGSVGAMHPYATVAVATCWWYRPTHDAFLSSYIDLLLNSVWNWRVPPVLLESPVLPGVLQPCDFQRRADVRHDDSFSRVVRGIRPDVPGGRWPLRLDTHCARRRRQHKEDLLVRSDGVRCRFQQKRELHVYPAQIRCRSNRRTTGRSSTADTITH